MLPRKSSVMKIVLCVAIAGTLLFLWATGPDTLAHTWKPLNETQLRIEFEKLRVEVNETVSYSIENKTAEEIYKYIQALKRKVPVNPHNFKYVINPSGICDGQDIYLLAYIHSAPNHHKQRTAIRESWGSWRNFNDLNYRVVFLLGLPENTLIQEAIEMENDQYGDIVQESFKDSYRNLTYKAIMGLKWVSSHCKNARFILKSDDDIFVNIFNLVNHLNSLELHNGPIQHLLLCLVWYRMKVVRDSKSKWYIPKEEFADDFFPTYCSGSAFVLSTDVVVSMYNASLYTPFFWVDDFFITGLLAGKLNIQHQKFNSVYVVGPSVFLERFTEESKWRTLVFGHVHNLNHMELVWKKVLVEHKGKRSNYTS